VLVALPFCFIFVCFLVWLFLQLGNVTPLVRSLNAVAADLACIARQRYIYFSEENVSLPLSRFTHFQVRWTRKELRVFVYSISADTK
jgi:hypothetical protein